MCSGLQSMRTSIFHCFLCFYSFLLQFVFPPSPSATAALNSSHIHLWAIIVLGSHLSVSHMINITLRKYVSYEEKGRDKWLFISATRAHVNLMIKKPYHCILWIEPFDKSFSCEYVVLMVSQIRMCSVILSYMRPFVLQAHESPYTVSVHIPFHSISPHTCVSFFVCFSNVYYVSLSFPFPISS